MALTVSNGMKEQLAGLNIIALIKGPWYLAADFL